MVLQHSIIYVALRLIEFDMQPQPFTDNFFLVLVSMFTWPQVLVSGRVHV